MSFDRKRKLKTPAVPFCEAHGAGWVVRSRTGRTRGKVFVTVGCETDAKGKLFVYVSDGVRFTAQTPKRKSAAHVEVVAQAGISPAQTDGEIRQILEQYR